MTWRLTVALILLAAVPVCAQGWLTVQTVAIQLEAPPADLLGTETPAEMVHVTVAGTDSSGADAISVRGDATALVFGPDELPQPPRHASIDVQRPEEGPAQVAIDIWFDVPLEDEMLQSAMLRLVLDHARRDTQDLAFQPAEGGWQLPVTVRTPWAEATVTGVGAGQTTGGVRAVRDWLGTGAEGPADVETTGMIMGQPRLMGFAELHMLGGVAEPEEIALILSVGDTQIAPGKTEVHSRSQPAADDLDLQRRVISCTFIYPEDADARQLPSISAITLRVTRIIPLTEHWLGRRAPEPPPEEQPAEGEGGGEGGDAGESADGGGEGG